MNIGIFTDCYYPQVNGVVTSTIILKEQLEKRGHNVTVVTVRVPEYQDEDPNILRVPSIPFKKWKEFRVGLVYPYSIIKKIHDLNLDIIHTQTEFSICLMARFLAKRFRIPVVHTYHTMYEDYTHYIAKTRINKRIAAKLSKVGSKLYLNQCASVIAPSEKTKKALIKYGVTNYIEIIPTGIKLDKFKKGLFTEEQIQNKRKELGIKPEEKIILSLGRVAEEKSIDVIIKQMPSIVSSNPQIKLLIVGDGPEKTNLEALSKRIGMERSICFTGKVPWNDTALYYQMADLFISASKTETQGLTILESMAAGTPVIVRHDENIKDLITNSINGMIFQDDSDLTSIILNVINNKGLLKTLSQNGIETAYKLSDKYFGHRVESLYYKILQGK